MNKNIIPLLIAFLSFLLFTYQLGSIPPSAYVDEATVGYNAYSIMQTVRDEYGQFLPIYIRYFAAYTPALYTYLVIPFIKFFGLTTFALRIGSVLSGAVLVFIVVKVISTFTTSKFSQILAGLIFTLTPWLVFNSRLGYEVMFATALFSFGFYLIFQNKPRYFLFGWFLISLSTYTAHTQRYLAPLFVLGYILFFRRLTKKESLILLVTQIPNIIMLFTPAFWTKTTSLTPQFFITNLILFLSPSTWFGALPDIDLQHQIPQTAPFLWWQILPLVIGIHAVTKFQKPHLRLLALVLLVSLVPASLTGEFISIQRALPLILPLGIIITLGVTRLPKLFQFGFLAYSLVLLYRSYFVFSPSLMAPAWNYGYTQLSKYINQNQGFHYVIDTTRNPRSYILYLFYSSYSPKKLLSQRLPLSNYYSQTTYSNTTSFGNIEFRPLNNSIDFCRSQIIIGDSLTFNPTDVAKYGLTRVFDVGDYRNNLLLVGYRTSPSPSCKRL